MRQDTAEYGAKRTIPTKVKPFYLAAGALVALLSLTAYSSAATRPTADTGQPKQQWQNEWEALVKAAKAEGRVVTEGYARAEWAPVFAVFTQKYGIEVISGAAAILVVDQRGGRDLFKAMAAGAPVATFDEAKFNTWKESAELTFSASERHLSPIHPSPNPNAARFLLNWLYSKEGQTALHLHHKGIPPPTLREDVTEWGRTDPLERRVPGKEYLVLDINPKWAEERLRAFYDEYRFRGR